jgi:hypothetical protein
MADTKVSDLTSATLPLDGTELIPIVQDGTSKKVTALGLMWKETEIDFGTKPVWDKTFTITDSSVTSTSHVIVAPSGKVATDRVGNDWEWDGLLMSALPVDGSFILTAFASPGPLVGKRFVQYQIG